MANNIYDTSSSYSPPPPEPSDDISLLLRQILFKSSSTSSTTSFSPFLTDPKQMKYEMMNPRQQPPQYSSSLPTLSSTTPSNNINNSNIPVNVIGYNVASSSVGTIDYDPDEHDSESEEGFEHLMEEMAAKPNPNPPRNPSKRTRAAEVHNMSEKRRRSRINEKMKALQKLIPNSNKTDKASMLDEAIEYLKQLQLQVQMLTMRNGVNLYSMCAPNQPNQRPSGMNQSINMTANLVNPMLGQHQPSILEFSQAMNQGPSFGTQLGSS